MNGSDRTVLQPGTPEDWDRVAANTGLVWFVVNRMPFRTEDDRNEAFQDGTIGLLRAAQKFDPDMGFRFSTYAMWWIKQGILRGIGRREGVNYRAADRAQLPYNAPHSLDSSAPDVDETIGGNLAAPDDTEAEAMFEAEIEAAFSTMRAHADTPFDTALVELFETNSLERLADVAAEHGVTDRYAAARLRRLRRYATRHRMT